jgi:hypothetical protein
MTDVNYFHILVYLVAIPLAVKVAKKAVALDAKLDPEPGIENESRLALLQLEQLKAEEKQRLSRSIYRRWFRAANYREENIQRVLEDRPARG